MAEELDIRSIWNKGKELEDPKSIQIDMMEKKGTKTTLYWIKIILWVEFFLTIVGIPFMIYYFKVTSARGGIMITYGIVTAIYLVYYQFLIRKINDFSYAGNVVQSLRHVYGYLRFYLLHYKVMIWVSLIVGYTYGLLHPQDPEAFAEIQTTKQWLVVIGVSATMLIIIGGLMHLLIHLIYGRKIKRLRRTVKDLEVEE